jgi:N-methylhydantoinase A
MRTMKSNTVSHRVGIDVGGTFTDFVMHDSSTGTIDVWKTLTTPQDPTVGIMSGLVDMVKSSGIGLDSVRNIVHGTTLVTNTVIERKGAPRIGLITTFGYRDTLEIGNEMRYDQHNLFIERPRPLVPRRLRREVRERVGPDGKVLVPIDTDEIARVGREFLEEGVDVIAVCLLHSYANPSHEITIEKTLKDLDPRLDITLSSRVAPEMREYERTCTTVLNAYVKPVLNKYFVKLNERLRTEGLRGSLYLMLSSGGTTTVPVATEFPIRLIESGPAAGALAAAFYSELCSKSRVLSLDMGGTTAKICIVDESQPEVATSFETDRMDRFKAGSGIPVKVPVLEMIEIGAGGGSIAHIDTMRLLKVGPISAGASPGPACYGLGGAHPTVTDADLVLGYLDPGYFLGGKMRLDRKAAQQAINEHVANPLKLDTLTAAAGIRNVVNQNMASAAKIHFAEKGRDPRRYTLVTFGGAAPLHAYSVAKLLHIETVICPFGAGTLSAFGMLASPMAFDFGRSYAGAIDRLDWKRVKELYQEMEDEGRAMLADGGVDASAVSIVRSADMRYVGQGHEISVSIPLTGLTAPDFPEQMKTRFNDAYRSTFGRHLDDIAIEALNWRCTVRGPRPEVSIKLYKEISAVAQEKKGRDPVKGRRQVYFEETKGYVETNVYDRFLLQPGMVVNGPAVIEENNSTTILGPSGTAEVDGYHSLILHVG